MAWEGGSGDKNLPWKCEDQNLDPYNPLKKTGGVAATVILTTQQEKPGDPQGKLAS